MVQLLPTGQRFSAGLSFGGATPRGVEPGADRLDSGMARPEPVQRTVWASSSRCSL
jgi:hypothetical protein